MGGSDASRDLPSCIGDAHRTNKLEYEATQLEGHRKLGRGGREREGFSFLGAKWRRKMKRKDILALVSQSSV